MWTDVFLLGGGAIALGLVAVSVVALVAIGVEHARRRAIRAAIVGTFRAVASKASKLGRVAVDAQWVALELCGFDYDTSWKSLAPEEQSEVARALARVTAEGERMLAEGLLAEVPFEAEVNGRRYSLRGPRTLWKLTTSGQVEALRGPREARGRGVRS